MAETASSNTTGSTTGADTSMATATNMNANSSVSPSQQTAVQKSKKQIFAIRHGESEWNVAIRKYHNKEVKSRWCPETYKPDCNITAKGRQQALKAGRELLEFLPTQNNTTTTTVMMISSPLRRAIQTANGVMEAAATAAACSNNDNDADGCSQVLFQQRVVDWRCAEVMVDSCDIGTPVENLQAEFPDWDFHLLKQQRPRYWWPYHRSLEETYKRMESRDPRDAEETDAMAQERLKDFKEHVRSLVNNNNNHNDEGNNSTATGTVPVDTLVIVAHSEIIWWLTSRPVGKGRHRKRKGAWLANGQVIDVTGAFLDGYSMDLSLLEKY